MYFVRYDKFLQFFFGKDFWTLFVEGHPNQHLSRRKMQQTFLIHYFYLLRYPRGLRIVITVKQNVSLVIKIVINICSYALVVPRLKVFTAEFPVFCQEVANVVSGLRLPFEIAIYDPPVFHMLCEFSLKFAEGYIF